MQTKSEQASALVSRIETVMGVEDVKILHELLGTAYGELLAAASARVPKEHTELTDSLYECDD